MDLCNTTCTTLSFTCAQHVQNSTRFSGRNKKTTCGNFKAGADSLGGEEGEGDFFGSDGERAKKGNSAPEETLMQTMHSRRLISRKLPFHLHCLTFVICSFHRPYLTVSATPECVCLPVCLPVCLSAAEGVPTGSDSLLLAVLAAEPW